MKNLIVLGFIVCLTSCNFFGNGIGFEINNISENKISEVKFYTSERLEIWNYDTINNHQKIEGFLSMMTNKVDGEYILEFKRPNGAHEILRCGYYSNGRALNQSVSFEVQKDTIMVKLK